jgi:mannose-6-phosphate isomerase-like protein (cupin superfamily)
MPEHRTDRGALLPPSAAPSVGERVEVVAAGATWRIEQILTGRLSEPVEDLLDHHEWAMIVHGRAVVDVDGRVAHLHAGEWLALGPGVPHKVLSADPGTTWLAVHLDLPGAEPAPENRTTTVGQDSEPI